MVTRYLESYPKVKFDEGQREIAEMIKLKRKPPHHPSTEHELEVGGDGCVDACQRHQLSTTDTERSSVVECLSNV